MSVRDLVDAIERWLPCPPSPLPEANADADYLWRATQINATHEGRPLQFVRLRPRVVELLPPFTPGEMPDFEVALITVECDERGRGMRVVR